MSRKYNPITREYVDRLGNTIVLDDTAFKARRQSKKKEKITRPPIEFKWSPAAKATTEQGWDYLCGVMDNMLRRFESDDNGYYLEFPKAKEWAAERIIRWEIHMNEFKEKFGVTQEYCYNPDCKDNHDPGNFRP